MRQGNPHFLFDDLKSEIINDVTAEVQNSNDSCRIFISSIYFAKLRWHGLVIIRDNGKIIVIII